MKKSIFSVLMCAAALALLGACSQKEADQKDNKAAKAPTASTKVLPNYRYVDIDTILDKYNLSKDYNEEMMRMQDQIESEAKRHESNIKSFANTMQHKMESNQYNEQNYTADQTKMQQMQANAQSSLEKMQTNSAKAAMDAQKVIQDSLNNFIEDYNAKHHYDAILYKAATMYIDPALDITDEVVEGLNARYNKVKK
ncbi:MAG: OmpH family outer membrane protein [Muribaculaceae bacterium]|nr:OmpH family outer membrane protein [Muribaculaceae bacterium]